jgi:starch synthase
MYSLRYGTIPVVRATGGLDDTIQEYDAARRSGNGFKFEAYSSEALLGSLKKAIDAYRRKDSWRELMQMSMACDFSWERSAREYLRLYQRISGF